MDADTRDLLAMVEDLSPAAQRLFVRVVSACRDGVDPAELIANAQHVSDEEKHIISEESRDLMIFETFQEEEKSYVASPEIWAKMESYLETNHLQLSVKNLHRAYQDVVTREKNAKAAETKPDLENLSNREITSIL